MSRSTVPAGDAVNNAWRGSTRGAIERHGGTRRHGGDVELGGVGRQIGVEFDRHAAGNLERQRAWLETFGAQHDRMVAQCEVGQQQRRLPR